MGSEIQISVIVPTCPERTAKLAKLLRGLAASRSGHHLFEVVLIVDGIDERPLEIARLLLPKSIHLEGATQAQRGPAAARNRAMQRARGEWLLFFDDDALVDEETLPGHLQCIRQSTPGLTAFLGRTYWPDELLDSPWQFLLSSTSMVFFWNRMRPGQRYGFRHFTTSNLCVPTRLVRAVGGFNESFPYAIHEDIELGYRLETGYGLQVQAVPEINSWHDHAISPRDYFFREHRSGEAAALARQINPAFHEQVWGWLGDPQNVLGTLRTVMMGQARGARRLLEEWAAPCDRQPSPPEMEAAYLAHLPLKRMLFCQGYVGRSFDDLWNLLAPKEVVRRADNWQPVQT